MKLLFVIFPFALGCCGFALNLSLRFRFFHGFLGFGGFFGAGFGALLALLVQNLLAAEQLEESLVSAVTLIPVSADNAGVSAVAVAKARSDGVELLHDRPIRLP